jgi:hypothetical protein
MLMILISSIPGASALSQGKLDTTGSTHTTPICAREVPSGSTVDPAAGRVVLPNGSVLAIANIHCTKTDIVMGTAVAYGQLTVTSSYHYTSYTDEWTVPPAPSSGSFTSGMFVSLWNGLEKSSDIVQPILVYGCITSSNCSNSWRISGYAICCGFFGSVYYSSPLTASATNTINGTLLLNPHVSLCSSNGPAYTVAAQDVSTSTSTNLVICTTDQFQTADAGALEYNGLTSCSQMPGNGYDDFTSIFFKTAPSTVSASQSTGSNGSFCRGNGAGWISTTLDIQWTYI